MRKILAMCLTLVVMIGTSLTVFATNGGFLESPSLHPEPEIVSFSVESDECDAQLVVISYLRRNLLDAEDREEIEDNYDEIKATDDLTTLNADLVALAERLNIDGTDLSVSDLFEMHYINCSHELHESENHGAFTIQLRADTLENFVGVLHYTEGAWELVHDATVDGDVVTIKIDDFSDFAFVVGKSDDMPQTGDNSNMYLWGAVIAVSAVAAVVFWRKSKKVVAK